MSNGRAAIHRDRVLPGLLAGLIVLLHLPVVFSHENYLLTWFNIDDGYYYFVVARNLAAGKGFTFDGLSATNGFHPLWMFITTPIFALPGKILPLRVLAALLAAMSAATALALYRLSAGRLGGGPAFLTALGFALLPPIHNTVVRGGMESGLSAFLIAFLLLRLANTRIGEARTVLGAGLVACAAFLARLDNIFLALLAGAWLLGRGWLLGEGLRVNWRRIRLPALHYFGPLAAVLVAYLLWNAVGFGTLTPVSGQVKQWWGTLPNSVYGFPPRRLSNVVAQILTDDDSIGPFSLATAPLYRAAERLAGEQASGRRVALVALAGGLGLTLAWLARREWAFVWKAGADLGLLPLFLGCALQIGYYKLSGSVAQRPWYWVGEMLLVVLLAGVILEAARRTAFGKVPGRRSQIIQAALGTLLAVLLVQPHLPRIGRILSPEIARDESYYLRRAAWIEGNTAPGARIGMTGSGSSAYFSSDRTFINLDGLIGSYDYFRSLQSGQAAGFLAGLGMEYVFGNEYIITVSDPYGDIFAGKLAPAAQFADGDRILLLWRFMP